MAVQALSILPYLWGYLAWLAFSAALYLTATTLLFRATALPAAQKIGGQLSVVIFFLWALFFQLRQQNRLFLAGVALALGIFKPTLVALPVAMLIIGHRWRIV